jgi:hypothetical protein
MLVIQLHQRILIFPRSAAHAVHPQQSNCPIIIRTRDQFIVAVIVLCVQHKRMMVCVNFNWKILLSSVPKFQALIMAGHQVILFVGVVID